MEKISGILPASPRTRAVDLSNAQPVRPGAPTWGRPVGRVTPRPAPEVTEKISLSSQNNSLDSMGSEASTPSSTYDSKGRVSKKEIVDDIAKKFFEAKNLARENDKTLSEQAEERVSEADEAFAPTVGA